MVFIGDSITQHGIVLNPLHWDHVSGMAATSAAKDYVHLVVSGLEQAMPHRQVQFKIFTPQAYAPAIKQLGQVGEFRPDLVVVQLGEHEYGNKETQAQLQTACQKLIGGLQALPSHPQVICTGAWQPDGGLPYTGWAATVEKTVRAVCQKEGAGFVSMEDVAHNPKYRGWGQHPGVRWHPNDLGHAMYAQRILAQWHKMTTAVSPEQTSRVEESNSTATPSLAQLQALWRAQWAKPYRPGMGTRYRGFNIETVYPDKFAPVLEAAVRDWHANVVRHAINAVAYANLVHEKSYAKAFDTLLAALPAELDVCKANGVAMVIVMPELGVPNENLRTYPAGKGKLIAFWNDPTNLQVLINCWQRIARVCANRDQAIWFDLLNEPLNWKDMPGYPRNWPDWAQKITDAIRAIDKHHPIMIETGPGGLCWGMKDFPMLHGGPFIYSIHVYVPHEYTHQGLADIQNTDLAKAYLQRQRPWPGNFADGNISGYWDKQTLERALAPAIDFQKRHPDIPIFVGEFSAIRWAPNAQQYLSDCISIFEKYGWDWCYHSFRGYSGWSLEDNDQFSSPQDAQRATHPTARALVIRRAMSRNDREP